MRNSVFKSPLVLFIITAIFPPFIHVVLGTSMYGGIRHWLLIYPFFAAIISFVLWRIIIFLKSTNSKLYFLGLLVLALIIFNQVYQNSRVFPLTYVYFNSLIGGESSAQYLFTMDHRLQSKYHVEKWISEQGGDRKKYQVVYEKYRSRARSQNILKKQLPIYIYQINGANIAYVFKRI